MFPYLTSHIPPIPFRFRQSPEDFRVDEIPAYPPTGEGTHLFVQFEKRGLSTAEAVKRLARAIGADPAQAGYAGMKDRQAVTTQWASFAGVGEAAARAASLEGIHVLRAVPHTSKLRTGHLRGNRFALLLRDWPAERTEDARAVLESLVTRGVPNYYGEQRFGRDGANLARANAWLAGGRAPKDRFERKLLFSVWQSSAFNDALAARLRSHTFDAVVNGDLVRKEDTGGMFVSTDPVADTERARRWEVSATGPMFGARMRWPDGEAATNERALLERIGVAADTLERFRAFGEGTRRPYRVPLSELSLEETPEGARLTFTLPKGSYATVVLRELAKADDASGRPLADDAPTDGSEARAAAPTE